MAATVIMSVPAIVLFFAAQRYFIRGIVMTGLKF
jgi:multiple sugar transport system permease protein